MNGSTKDKEMNPQEENEIDLVEVVCKLWAKRNFILKVTAVFMVLGLLVAIFSAKEFTAGCTIVPQTGEKSMGGSLGGLAAMAGINLGSMGSGETLSPKIYPKVLQSVPFQKELMAVPIKFEEYDEPVELLAYFTDDKYAKFSLFGTIGKYTVGLPFVILKAIRGEQPEIAIPQGGSYILETLTKDEDECRKILSERVSLNLNEKDGYITLSVDMPEALAAAQLAARVQEMLQKYITEFKIEKAKANLTFVEERFAEAKQHFEQRQEDLAAFRDANRNFASAVAKTTEERLSNEYNVALGVYSELAKQREQANIQVKEDTPIFTVVEPVTVPSERSKPKRALIMIAFTFLGGFIGIGLVLVLPFLAQVSGWKRLKDWAPESK